MHPTLTRIVQSPQVCMSGGVQPYFELHELARAADLLSAGGPLDAPHALPIGGAWNLELQGVQLSYGSVLRPGWLA